MSSPDLTLFWIAFFAYLAGFLFYSMYLGFKNEVFAKLGFYAMIAGFIPQTAAFIVRWIIVDHVPLSNMYEYMALMSWMATLSLLMIVIRYKIKAFGAFIAPVVFMLMVLASMLPKDISQALMPALQSYWLTIHVTLAALGSGSFAVACAVSFIYLLKKSSENSKGLFLERKSRSDAIISMLLFPIAFAVIASLSGILPDNSEMVFNLSDKPFTGLGKVFIGLGLGFPLGAILWPLLHRQSKEGKRENNIGAGLFTVSVLSVLVSGLICGLLLTNGVIVLSLKSAWKIVEFAGINWLVGILVFLPLYWILVKKGFPYFKKTGINTDLLDEINYKTVGLGYPLYTVGALFAGAIWAEQAWGQFWGWDPKEVGALIIWLFYSGFLHARRQQNWRGNRAAILSIFGLLMILLSFFGNYFFGGQHAYT